MYKFINYIDIVSNALLGVLDGEENCIIDSNDKIYIELNKQNQELLRFYIKSNIRDEMGFGVTNIIINTCRPYDNWRKDERGKAIKGCKYYISDDSFTTSKQKLEYFLDSTWKWLKSEVKNTIFISDESIDIIDLTTIITDQLGVRVLTPIPYYHIIGDVNMEYHRNDDIPEYIKYTVEEKLITLELLTP